MILFLFQLFLTIGAAVYSIISIQVINDLLRYKENKSVTIEE
jgi:hypothetical protein